MAYTPSVIPEGKFEWVSKEDARHLYRCIVFCIKQRITWLQEAEAEQQEAAKQAKAAARRAALEAAAAQRAEEARKRHEFMQETKKVSCQEFDYWVGC